MFPLLRVLGEAAVEEEAEEVEAVARCVGVEVEEAQYAAEEAEEERCAAVEEEAEGVQCVGVEVEEADR